MPFVPTKLAQSAPANTSETTIYTVPSGTKCSVKQITIANVTGSSDTVSISLVPSGDSASDANRITKEQPIPANSTTNMDLSQVLVAGDFISIQVGTSDAITVTVSGIEFSGEGVAAFKDYADIYRTSGNIAITSTSFVDVDAATNLTIDASVGDLLEVGVSFICDNGSPVLDGDAETVVSGSGVNRLGETNGLGAWNVRGGNFFAAAGSHLYEVVSGDIEGGEVTVRLLARIETSGTRNIISNTDAPLHFFVINHGVSSAAAVSGSLLDAKGDLIVATADDSPARLAVGTDGQVLTADAAEATGVKWADSGGLSDFDQSVRTSGDLTLNNTSWDNVDTGLDITLSAAEGDVIEVGLSGVSVSAAVTMSLDAATIVSGAVVNTFSTQGSEDGSSQGIGSWYCISNNHALMAGGAMYTLQAGDISSGTVTLRLRYRTLTATNRNITGNTSIPLFFTAKNLGPKP